MKHTKGKWEPIYEHYNKEPKKICTGVGIIIYPRGGKYIEFICNSLLPNTDEEYLKQREEIEANMKLIAAAPELLIACMDAKTMLYNICNDMEQRSPEELQSILDVAIKKATE